jgi:hypothetical protein
MPQRYAGLFARILLPKVAQALQEPQVLKEVRFAEATKHSQLGQGAQTLRPILMHITTGVLFLGVIDELMHVALHCPIAPGEVGVETTAQRSGGLPAGGTGRLQGMRSRGAGAKELLTLFCHTGTKPWKLFITAIKL